MVEARTSQPLSTPRSGSRARRAVGPAAAAALVTGALAVAVHHWSVGIPLSQPLERLGAALEFHSSAEALSPEDTPALAALETWDRWQLDAIHVAAARAVALPPEALSESERANLTALADGTAHVLDNAVHLGPEWMSYNAPEPATDPSAQRRESWAQIYDAARTLGMRGSNDLIREYGDTIVEAVPSEVRMLVDLGLEARTVQDKSLDIPADARHSGAAGAMLRISATHAGELQAAVEAATGLSIGPSVLVSVEDMSDIRDRVDSGWSTTFVLGRQLQKAQDPVIARIGADASAAGRKMQNWMDAVSDHGLLATNGSLLGASQPTSLGRVEGVPAPAGRPATTPTSTFVTDR